MLAAPKGRYWMAEKPQPEDEAAALAQQLKVDASVNFGIEGPTFAEDEWTAIAKWIAERFGTEPLNAWLDRKWVQFGEQNAAKEVADSDWVRFVYRELVADPPQGLL
jgi:hypothetical protein